MSRTRVRSRLLAPFALVAVLVFGLAQAAVATPGALDPSFDGDGVATFDLVSESGTVVREGPAGKLYVAGETFDGSDEDFVVVRIKPGGARDTAYGEDGFAVIGGAGDTDRSHGLVVLGDGSAIVAGTSQVGALNKGLVVKLTPEGDPSGTFGGGDGKVLVGNGSADVLLNDVAVQSDGKIVVVGATFPTSVDGQLLLVRLKPNGSPDPSFGNNGKVQIPATAGDDGLVRVAIQPDGRIVAGGWTEEAPGEFVYDTLFARFLADGRRDSTFGTKGLSVIQMWEGGDDFVNGMVLLPTGKIASCQDLTASEEYVSVMRVTARGKVDITFGGGDGVATIASPNGECKDIAAQEDGKLVLVATTETMPFTTARLLSGGKLDTTYGDEGFAEVDLGTVNTEPHGITVQANGRIVVTGSVSVSGTDIVVARLLP